VNAVLRPLQATTVSPSALLGALEVDPFQLEWNRTPGGGGAGLSRGCQAAEFWLINQNPELFVSDS